MKRIVILFLLLTILMSVNAQESEKPAQSRFSWGLMLSPDYCYRRLTKDNDWFTEYIKEIRYKYEKSGIGFSVGTLLRYNASKHFFIESGLVFSNHRITTENIANTDWIHEPEPGLKEAYLNKSAYYLQIPINFNFRFMTKSRIQPVVGIGLTVAKQVGGQRTTKFEFDDGRESIHQSKYGVWFMETQYLGMLSAGFDYAINRNLLLNARVMYKSRLHYNMFIKGNDIPVYKYSYGLNISCLYTIDKKVKNKK